MKVWFVIDAKVQFNVLVCSTKNNILQESNLFYDPQIFRSKNRSKIHTMPCIKQIEMYACHRNTKTWQNLSNTGSLIHTATHEYLASEKAVKYRVSINNQLYITHQIEIVYLLYRHQIQHNLSTFSFRTVVHINIFSMLYAIFRCLELSL